MTSLYVAAGRVPSPGDFDFAETELLRSLGPAHSEQRLILPQTQDIDYFLRIDVRDTHPHFYKELVDSHFELRGSHEHFRLGLTVLPFTVSALWPARAGNTGPVTFEVTASKLDPCSVIELIREGQVVRQPAEIRLID